MASLKLYQSTIEDRIEKIKLDYNNDSHESFLRFIFYLVTGNGHKDLEPEDIIDGSGEYQIDALHIDTTNEEQSIVTVIQVTYSDSLSSSKIITLATGLDYLLRQPKSMYSSLSNSALVDKIQDFRDLRGEVLPANIKLQCFYACLSDASKPSVEFVEQKNKIINDFGNDVGEFKFEVLGVEEIFNLLNLRERKSAKVNEKMKIIYDQNKANLLEHSIEDVSGVICTVEGAEIARLVKQYDAVFEENLRRFLGSSGSINRGIQDSCTSDEIAPMFWFLNNGITIICDDYTVHKDFDNPFVDIKNLRIVNGCQTASTLANMFHDTQKALQPSVRIMVRVLKTRNRNLSERLVITTNTQNKITSRDLHAQDEIQRSLQIEFERRFNIRYERTTNEFGNVSGMEIVSNEKIGQAYLAIVKKRLSDANRRQYKLWGEYYKQTFTSSVFPEAYLLCFRIVESCTAYKRVLLKSLPKGDLKRTLIANGTYHIARIVAFQWREGDDWNDVEKIRRELQKLKDEPDFLNQFYDIAIELLQEIFQADEQLKKDPSVAMKSSRLEELLEKRLYASNTYSSKRRAKKPRKPKAK